jgi:hypothetical protein
MIGMWLPSTAPKMYGIPCKLSNSKAICFIIDNVGLGKTKGLKIFLIPSHTSLTMIEALDFEIPYKSASVCKVLPVTNQCNVKEILHSIGI